MGYEELKGTDQDAAQIKLKKILERENTVTMIVMGADQEDIAVKAKTVAEGDSNTWCVVWVQNLNLLTEEQIAKYKGHDSKTVVCVLSATGQPVRRLSVEKAQFDGQLEISFLKAQAAD